MSRFIDDIDEFWFVDLDSLPGLHRFDKASIDDCGYLFEAHPRLQALSYTTEGELGGDIQYRQDGTTKKWYRWLAPCIRTETYAVTGTDRTIRVIRKRGFGIYTLMNALPYIDIFFYRGDSEGEGGSGDPWYRPDIFRQVLDKLADGGLFVTDGSNMKYRNPWDHLRAYAGLREHRTELVRPFQVLERRFECVGFAGHRYGLTLVWKVNRIVDSVPGHETKGQATHVGL